MDSRSLTENLRNALSGALVEQISDRSYRVNVPNLRSMHDTVTFSILEGEDGWTLSDSGTLQYLLDEDHARILGIMECAGASFGDHDGMAEFTVRHESALVESVLSFAHYLAATPTVWHALECAKVAGTAPPNSVDLMAKEAKSLLVSRLNGHTQSLVRLHHTVRDRDEAFPAPLAVAARRTKIRPPLVASFIDTTASKAAQTAAKRNTAFLFEILRDWSTTRKYVVVRGEEPQVDHFAEFYDQNSITTVSTQDYGTFVEDVEEAMHVLIPS